MNQSNFVAFETKLKKLSASFCGRPCYFICVFKSTVHSKPYIVLSSFISHLTQFKASVVVNQWNTHFVYERYRLPVGVIDLPPSFVNSTCKFNLSTLHILSFIVRVPKTKNGGLRKHTPHCVPFAITHAPSHRRYKAFNVIFWCCTY